MIKKILIIDDEEDFAQGVKANLEETGNYSVRIETKGKWGVIAARDFMPDLIFLDIVMPDASGGEVAQEILADKACKNIPIIFLTAIVEKEEIESQHSTIGGRIFLAKPVTTEQLIACIERHTR